jgi:Cof subfamily protein (haloacid dehalogenase superfamily)
MIKIIALDLDGTLLDSRKGLSDRNRRALEAAAERGALVVPTTGRFFGMMPEAVRNLDFVRYAITINGAAVYDRETERTILREEIPLSLALEVIQTLDRYDVIDDCYRGDWGWITSSFVDKAEGYATDRHYLQMIRDYRTPVHELKAYLSATAEEGDVQKIMLFSRNDDPAASTLADITKTMERRFKDIRVTKSTWNNLELNIDTAHKGNTLVRFAGMLGYSLDECMAFGDGLNDLTMISAARYGLAMANADEAVKAAARSVTGTNDEDGVAMAIEKAIAEGLL